MRNASVMRTPRPSGEGSFVGRHVRRLGLAVLSAALIVGIVAPAHAANVTVLFSAMYTRAAGAQQVPGALCPVSVPEGSDGVAVLSAAKTAGCIASYETLSFGFGRFVNCIGGVCGGEGPGGYWYWGMHLQGVPTCYGVDDYRAANGDHLMFAYQTFVPIPSTC